MESYITKCIAGFFTYDKDLKLINYKIFQNENIVSNQLKIEDKEVLNEELDLINELSEDYDIIHLESRNRLSQYKKTKGFDKLVIDSPNIAGE